MVVNVCVQLFSILFNPRVWTPPVLEPIHAFLVIRRSVQLGRYPDSSDDESNKEIFSIQNIL
jgi:hypothetical protein